MKSFKITKWLDDEYLSAKKAANSVQLIKNYTYFGTVIGSGSEKYYDLVIPTKTKTGFNWWRINIMPVYNDKRADDVSKVDLKTIIIDDNIFLPLGGSDWQKRLNHEDAVVNTIPYFEDWTEIFEQLSDILDRMIAKKEGTELEEKTDSTMKYDTALEILAESSDIPNDYEFSDLKWMFKNYNFDYARSYGPERAYWKLLNKFREFHDGMVYGLVPGSYAEWEDELGWSIGEEPPSDSWYD